MLSLDVEATSIAILAWLHEERFAGNVRSAVEWLAAQCQDGGFGSTQGTVLALKAIIAYVTSRRVCQLCFASLIAYVRCDTVVQL